LACHTRGIHKQMHYYFSKWSITFSTNLLLMSMSFLIPSAWNIFACIWSHICIVFLATSVYENCLSLSSL
jgi:hypothetical protein